MSASWEMQLVSAVIRNPDPSGTLRRVQDTGIRVTHFMVPEARLVWNEIVAHHDRLNNYGHVPSEQALKEKFKSIDLPTPVENVVDLCSKVLEGYSRKQVERLLDTYQETSRNDAMAALSSLTANLSALQEAVRPNGDVDFKKVAVAELAEHFLRAAENDGITGLPWPWERMNNATQGMQPGDFYLVWALPKSMKTWFGLVVSAYLFARGYRVLVYSKEMKWKQLRDRIACLIARIDYDDFKVARMSESEKERFLLAIEFVTSEDHPGQLMYTSADRLDGGPGGPAEIRSRVMQYRPDFVLLDSSYMLEMPTASPSNSLDWKNVGAVMAALKQVAKNANIVMMAISQENERAALKYKNTRGTASMAFSTNIAADCDLGLRLVLHKRLRQLSLHIAIARETLAEGFTINALACTDFEYVSDHLWDVGDDCEEEAPTPTPVSAQEQAAAARAAEGAPTGLAAIRAATGVQTAIPLPRPPPPPAADEEDEDPFNFDGDQPEV